MKFKQDNKYFWIYRSEETFILDGFTCKWEYENFSKFSNYEKPYCDSGRANFTLELVREYIDDGNSGKPAPWITVSDYCYNFRTKKEMLSLMNELMLEFRGEKEKFWNHDDFRINNNKQQQVIK